MTSESNADQSGSALAGSGGGGVASLWKLMSPEIAPRREEDAAKPSAVREPAQLTLKPDDAEGFEAPVSGLVFAEYQPAPGEFESAPANQPAPAAAGLPGWPGRSSGTGGPNVRGTGEDSVTTVRPVWVGSVEICDLTTCRAWSTLPIRQKPAIWRRLRMAPVGVLFSMGLHVMAAALLAGATYSEWSAPVVAWVEARLDDPALPAPEPAESPFELLQPGPHETSATTAIEARSIGAEHTTEPVQKMAPIELVDSTLIETAAPRPVYDIPEGLEVDQRLVVQGTTGEALVEVEAALDLITFEIASQLQEHPLLVVWLLDASGSLKSQRERIAGRLDRVYRELGALDDADQVISRRDAALLSAVVSYGEGTSFLADPTSRFDQISKAVRSVAADPSGIENIFSSVEAVLRKWGKLRQDDGRHLMLVIVTDETGDDFGHLERAILGCRRSGAKAYVVGPSALFGRRQGFVPYVAPEDGKTYPLPVDLGPESFVNEVVSLPFWFAGPQLENLSSAMGPYGLSRLVRETGGVYFQTTLTTSSAFAPTGLFDPQAVRPFAPDYRFGTPQEYVKDVNRHPLRQAVMRAAELSLKRKVHGTPPLEMRVTPRNYLQQLNAAQRQVAESSYVIEELLTGFTPKLQREYDRESDLRWRVNYDLSLGRLLAMRVRTIEYNLACAQLKQLGAAEVEQKANRFVFQPTAQQFTAGAISRKQTREAEALLRRVLETAPGTPWAALAQRELNFPFGITVTRQFDPPPPPKPRETPRTTPPEKPDPRRKGPLQLADDPQKRGPTPKPTPPAPPPKLPRL